MPNATTPSVSLTQLADMLDLVLQGKTAQPMDATFDHLAINHIQRKVRDGAVTLITISTRQDEVYEVGTIKSADDLDITVEDQDGCPCVIRFFPAVAQLPLSTVVAA